MTNLTLKEAVERLNNFLAENPNLADVEITAESGYDDEFRSEWNEIQLAECGTTILNLMK